MAPLNTLLRPLESPLTSPLPSVVAPSPLSVSREQGADGDLNEEQGPLVTMDRSSAEVLQASTPFQQNMSVDGMLAIRPGDDGKDASKARAEGMNMEDTDADADGDPDDEVVARGSVEREGDSSQNGFLSGDGTRYSGIKRRRDGSPVSSVPPQANSPPSDGHSEALRDVVAEQTREGVPQGMDALSFLAEAAGRSEREPEHHADSSDLAGRGGDTDGHDEHQHHESLPLPSADDTSGHTHKTSRSRSATPASVPAPPSSSASSARTLPIAIAGKKAKASKAPVVSGSVSKRGSAASRSREQTRTPTPASNVSGASPASEEGTAPAAKSKGKGKKAKANASVKKVEEEEPEEEGEEEDGAKEEDEEEKVHCFCKKKDSELDDGMIMLACDKCDAWYHTTCVGLRDEDGDLVDMYVCPNCERVTKEQTTWRLPCAREGCRMPVAPVSKYCSERCGILVAMQRIRTSKAKPDKLWGLKRIREARKKEGRVVWAANAGGARRESGAELEDGNGRAGDGRWRWRKLIIGSDEEEEEGWKPPTTSNGFISPTSPGNAGVAPHSSAALAELAEKRAGLKRLLASRSALDASLAPLLARSRLLELASARCAALPSVVSSSTSAPSGGSKKSKAYGGGANGGKDAMCGFDSRIAWDDDELKEWAESEKGKAILRGSVDLDGRIDPPPPPVTADGAAGANGAPASHAPTGDLAGGSGGGESETIVCGVGRRRCGRHAGWEMVRGAEFETEKEIKNAALANLSAQERELRMAIEDLEAEAEADERRKRRRGEVELAKLRALANGTRVKG